MRLKASNVSRIITAIKTKTPREPFTFRIFDHHMSKISYPSKDALIVEKNHRSGLNETLRDPAPRDLETKEHNNAHAPFIGLNSGIKLMRYSSRPSFSFTKNRYFEKLINKLGS